MPSLFLTMLATALVASAGGESRLAGWLAGRLGSAWGLLAVIWSSTAASTAIAAALAASIATFLTAEGKQVFAAIAFLLASIEMMIRRGGRRPEEPTRSLGAIWLVLFARQLTDGARFLVLALAVLTGSPILAALGGTIGTGLVMTGAWAIGDEWEALVSRRILHLLAATVLLVTAIALAVSGLRLID